MSADGRELAAIFAGGFAGAVARAELSELLTHHPGSWPWATFAVNLAGAALLGWLVTGLRRRASLPDYRLALLGTGFCGALTTFSTMQVELFQMLEHGRVGLAVLYAAASIGGGLLAVAAASRISRSTGAAT